MGPGPAALCTSATSKTLTGRQDCLAAGCLHNPRKAPTLHCNTPPPPSGHGCSESLLGDFLQDSTAMGSDLDSSVGFRTHRLCDRLGGSAHSAQEAPAG